MKQIYNKFFELECESEVGMTPAQAKAKLRDQGITSKVWADENGFDYHTVIQVLNGGNKGHYGQAYQVAKKLGIKQVGA